VFSPEASRELNIFLLPPFASAGEQNHKLLAIVREVDPVSGAKIKP
jgi:hypothetical protein